eukprot:gnl/MRDRNA2_/MRDRNA2_52183_c0_seq1.p1 gnl/MRDRNA2_/MRDRNA2_52183_c0~~gnl/MRDRNA2_/MRDRNA2_52183_c0_seq1.p1  ORF type:complete len:310 (-),score=48.40 gnl/MRDRNA2_/MRDRNA2_52183_c0_seq1:410-1216(-)
MTAFTAKLQVSLAKAVALQATSSCGIEDYYLLNGNRVEEDNAVTVYQTFPRVIAAIVFFVLACVGIAFGHIAAPLRMLITNFLPVLCVYGLTVMVYVSGILDWTGATSVQHSTSGIWFGCVAFTCSPLIGLSLDYDIFLFSRVSELRFAGQSQEESIKLALASTGPTITAAGLAMAVSMGAMLFSSIPGFNQVGFIMVAGILLDTFIVRTLFVPSLLLALGDKSYFPLKPPHVKDALQKMRHPLLNMISKKVYAIDQIFDRDSAIMGA